LIGKILLFALVLVLDQWTKTIAAQSLSVNDPLAVIPDLFNLTLVYNPGAAFGMFSGLSDGWRRITLAVVSIIALIVVLHFMFKEAKGDKVSQYALIAILAGAAGNLIDRYRFDSVVDFLDFYWKNYHWPAFNIADSAISVGVAVLMVRVLFSKPEKIEPASAVALPPSNSDRP
jgi:signal peptidase II